MGTGLTSSSFFSSPLSVCVCVLLVVVTRVEARPKGTEDTASDWSSEWQDVADWWKPTSDKDKWRAFEPQKETSTTHWWEEKLDDKLWDPESHTVTPGVVEAEVKPKPVETVKAKPDHKDEIKPNTLDSGVGEGEKNVLESVITKSPVNVAKTESVTEKTTTSKSIDQESDSDPAYYRRGELNSFVDPEPGSYYQPIGKNFGEKSWDSSYHQFYHKDVPSIPHTSHKVQEKTNVEDDKKEEEKIQNDDTEQVSKMKEEKVDSKKNGDTVSNLATGYQVDSPDPKTDEIISARDEDNTISESEGDKEIDESEKKDVEEEKIIEHQNRESVNQDANAIYGKGESIATLGQGAMNKAKKDKPDTATAKTTPEDVTKKPANDFVDWEDWDSSVFDKFFDEEEDEEEDEEDENEEGSEYGDSSNESSDNESNESDESDEDEDYYEDWYSDWDDDYDDDDEDEDKLYEDDEYEITDGKKGDITVSPLKEHKIEEEGKPFWSPKTVKDVDIDTMPIQADEAANHVDHSHYSKGVIYDSNYPNHKPSVKKDLNNPANSKQEGASWTNKKSDVQDTDRSEPHQGSAKKELSVTHFQPGQLNTESDASTSPNPPPPGIVGKEGVPMTQTPATAASVPNRDEVVQDVGDLGKAGKGDGFITSFPLEFCKVEYECRAGRTCIHGVCKCVTPSMCAGHHKPICGSDGVQYSSHCELHRTACVNGVHIRVDRRGRCFRKDIKGKEKSWLMEQEKLLQEDREKPQGDQPMQIPSKEIYEFNGDLKKDQKTSDVKKAYNMNEERSGNNKNMAAPTTTSTTTTTEAKKECTWKEMNIFKDSLLMFYCQKFVEPNCKVEVKTDREYLSMLMFSYYDQDFDYFLTAKELDDTERDEHFAKNIIVNCHLHDFVKYADTTDADGKLTVSEFTNAFEVAVPSTPPHVQIEVIPTLASAGNGLELKCGIEAPTVIWRRHGAQLSDDKRSHQLMVFDDGALFFSKIGLHHVGNYTCMDADNEANAQIHRLRVQTLPVVEVTPVTQTHLTGSEIELHCHAEGVPKPTISWKQGEEVLHSTAHSTHYYGGGHVVIHNAQFDKDAGTYTCSAHNQAGTTEKSVSVTVLPPKSSSSKESSKEAGTFVVFHSKGISAYDPLRCLLRHQVPGDFGNFKFIPDALDGPLTLCRPGKDCQWGGAVKVGSEFIYASQPDQSRVVVMKADNSWNPVQVIDTDKRPLKLWYVPHLDQVWVLCGNQEDSEGSKTIVVIRDASQHIQHRSVHTRPVGNHFDMVQDLFIAPTNDLEHEFDFGYVSHSGQNGLFKLSLEDMSYTKAIDLTNYGCVPTNIAFVPIGGHVIVQCVSAADQHTLQLTMDYLTDTITSTTSLNGRPMTSPDSRHLVTVDEFTGKVTVASVSDEGVLETTYEVTVSASISDIAFMPSSSHHGYNLVLTSADDDDVIVMNLVNGKVEKISGSQYSDPSSAWHPSPIHRHIVSGNTMSNYLMAPSKSSLAILDLKFKQVECEFLDSLGSDVMIHVPSSHTS